MTSKNQRLIFGIMAFALPALLVGIILSPLVAPSKDELAYLVVGNVLSWPIIILNFLFGSSDGSKDKTELMATRPDGTPDDPVNVERQ